MTVCTEEKTTLEKHLCFVLGRTVDLRSSELLSLTATDLKRAYYRRAHEFHPDKAAGLGLDPDYLSDRFRSLQDSYAFLLESLDSGLFTRYAGKRESVVFRSSQAGSSAYSGAQTSRSPTSGSRPDFRRNPEFSARSAKGSNTGFADLKQERPSASGSASAVSVQSGWYQGSSVPCFPLRLAQFLYYSRKIDASTLIKALSWQYRVRPKLGDLAISLGYMTPRDVLFVIRQKKPSEFFGETALRLGFLTPYRFSVLMGRQRLLNFPIGRFFVDHGYLSSEELSDSLEKLTAHNFRARVASRSLAYGNSAK